MKTKTLNNGASRVNKRVFRPCAAHPPKLEAYFDSYRQHYWIQDQRERWMPMNETGLKRAIRATGVSAKPAKDQPVSDLDFAILEIQHNCNVDYAASLAGYSKGIYEILGNRVLVVDSPKLIEPVKGSWDVLKIVLIGLLVDEQVDQTPYLFAWLKMALESLRTGQSRGGQAFAMAGPRDCGKSLLQKIITELLGGRMASPYQYMTGATAFNSEMFRAEHLVIEDNAASTDIRARRSFGAMLKAITANDCQPCYAKGKQAISLTPFWRLSISVNDEPENLMVLPPIDDSIEDKLILVKAISTPMPMPTTKTEDRTRFWNVLVSELPAFVHFLQEWEVPAELLKGRYGVIKYQHPDLLRTLDDLAPEKRLLDLIDAELFGGPLEDAWEGKAEQLEKLLTGGESGSAFEARRILSFNTACGVYLARLAKKQPGRVSKRVLHGITFWTVEPPEKGGG